MSVKVLIVDDEPAMREVIGLILNDFVITEASNGYEGLKVFEEVRPDLVLMDVMMPKMDGVEATKAILKRFPDAKVLAITAYATNKGKEMLEAGAIGLLEKPFRREQLKSLVKEVCDDKKEIRKPI